MRHFRQLPEVDLAQDDPIAEPGKTTGASGDGGTVGIESEEPAVGNARFEDSFGMAGSAEGGVDLEAAGFGGECFNYLVHHHRQVPYLEFGAPLEGAGGRATDLVERVLKAHLVHLDRQPGKQRAELVAFDVVFELSPAAGRPDFDMVASPDHHGFSGQVRPVAERQREQDSTLSVRFDVERVAEDEPSELAALLVTDRKSTRLNSSH